ncbi:MAG TPA: LysM peptidoglycan-binding domain-containing protein [Gemmatimonadales bacterium]|nr:LysM peptidoglycan-binding domain-containing protein [Gemmatimonadales bacterium]
MKRSSFVWTGLFLVGACAPALPPAPSLAPTALHDSLIPSLDPVPGAEAVTPADAEVLDRLAASGPDEATVPAFDGSQVRWDIDVRTYADHPRVQYYLRYFQDQARSRMGVFLERGARYDAMIRQRFEAEGLPGDLGFLALIESGYSSEAVSRSYAVGMWQFMRGTGRGYGLRVDGWVDERRDPMKATDAAARHLRDLRRRFGSLYLAAAAYNAGAGKVSRSLGKLTWDTVAVVEAAATEDSLADAAADAEAEADGEEEEPAELAEATTTVTSDAAFFRLAGSDLLAAETQDYVPKLIAAAIVAKQPGRFGFELPVARPFAYDSLVVTETTGLDVVARLAGVTVEEIRQLNLQYLRLATPPRSVSAIRLPSGTGETVARAYAELPPGKRVRFLTHEVRRRETLSAVARRYRIPAAEIRSANPKLHGGKLKAGARLVIPTVAVPSALAMRAAGAPAGHRAALAARTHRVRRGETLSGIAVRYRVSLGALRRVNAIRNDDYLRAGMRLRIPG